MKLRSIEAEGETVTLRLETNQIHRLSTKALWQLGRFIYGNKQWNQLASSKANVRNLLLSSYAQERLGGLDLELRYGENMMIISMSKTSIDINTVKTIINEALDEMGAANIVWNGYLSTATFLNKEVIVSAGDKYGISAIYVGPKIGEFQWPRNYLVEYGAKQFALKVATRRAKRLKQQLKTATKTVLDRWPEYEQSIIQAKQTPLNRLQVAPIIEHLFTMYPMQSRTRKLILSNFVQEPDKNLFRLGELIIEAALNDGVKDWQLAIGVASCLLTITDMGALYEKCSKSLT